MRFTSAFLVLVSAFTFSSAAFAGVIASTDDARAAAAQVVSSAPALAHADAAPLAVTSTDAARRAHQAQQQRRADRAARTVSPASQAPLHVTSTDEARIAAR